MSDGPHGATVSPDQAGLTVAHLSKTFGGQRALDDVSLTVANGAVTAVLGHNGSGKSTLIKILAGFHRPDPGAVIHVHGEAIQIPVEPDDVRRRGLRFVHQDLGLVDDLTVADNFALAASTPRLNGWLRRDLSAELDHVRSCLERFGIDVDPRARIGALDPTTKTMVAIARSVQDEAGAARGELRPILVLDEPTAALPTEQVGRILKLTRGISDAGGAVIYVTHRIDEVLEIADDVVILRDGRVIADQAMGGLSPDRIVGLIAGETPDGTPAPRPVTPGPRVERRNGDGADARLSVTGLSAERLNDVDLEIGRGEIVGIAGLMGCGRSELARIVAGAQAPRAGSMTLEGTPYHPKTPLQALKAGVAYVPQDRRGQGCVPQMSMQHNLTLGTISEFTALGRVRQRDEQRAAMTSARRLNVVPLDPRRLVANFSGGNQQKVVIAKALRHAPRVLVLDDPMQGIDVGARREIAGILREIADGGMAVLVGSTDMEDLVGLCDRVIVLSRGEVVGELADDELTKERLILVSSAAE